MTILRQSFVLSLDGPRHTFLAMGGQKDSTTVEFSAAGLSVTTNGQFSGLRLAHRIHIPHTSIPVRAYQGTVLYPDRMDNMFSVPQWQWGDGTKC